MGKGRQEKKRAYAEWADSVRSHGCDAPGHSCAVAHEREDQAYRNLTAGQKVRAQGDRRELRDEAGKQFGRR